MRLKIATNTEIDAQINPEKRLCRLLWNSIEFMLGIEIKLVFDETELSFE
jgi:hypothetical protein